MVDTVITTEVLDQALVGGFISNVLINYVIYKGVFTFIKTPF
jgi:hypothetical protein